MPLYEHNNKDGGKLDRLGRLDRLDKVDRLDRVDKVDKAGAPPVAGSRNAPVHNSCTRPITWPVFCCSRNAAQMSYVVGWLLAVVG